MILDSCTKPRGRGTSIIKQNEKWVWKLTDIGWRRMNECCTVKSPFKGSHWDCNLLSLQVWNRELENDYVLSSYKHPSDNKSKNVVGVALLFVILLLVTSDSRKKNVPAVGTPNLTLWNFDSQVFDFATNEKGFEVKTLKTESSLEAAQNANKRQPLRNRQLSGGDKSPSDGLCVKELLHYVKIIKCKLRELTTRSKCVHRSRNVFQHVILFWLAYSLVCCGMRWVFLVCVLAAFLVRSVMDSS